MLSIELDKQIFWTEEQKNHYLRLVAEKAVIAYVCTDQHGRPSNGGPKTPEWQVSPGLVQKISRPLQLCGPGALHGTFESHRWKGCRVWVAGFCGEVIQEDYKLGSLHREIIGEVFPETAMSQSVLARLGGKELSGANLNGANLFGANLYRADLSRADLSEANLYRADLSGANLSGANLFGANLSGANLFGANLYRADLSRADLSGVNLSGANLIEANFSEAYRGDSSDIPGWTNKNGYLFIS